MSNDATKLRQCAAQIKAPGGSLAATVRCSNYTKDGEYCWRHAPPPPCPLHCSHEDCGE